MKKKMTKTAVKKSAPAKSAAKTGPGKSSMNGKSSAKSNPMDIIELILKDHKPIKELIEVMKDEEAEFSEKQQAFEDFAPLLLAHAEAEQLSLYVRMKDEDELRELGFEGDVEHAIATQLIEELQSMQGDEDLWMARCKVLAEIVEHHIEEEEDDFIKEVRKEFDVETRAVIGQEYLNFKEDFEANGPQEKSEKSKKDSELRAH